MRYATSSLIGILLVLVFPQVSGEAETTARASASARIALNLPVRVSLQASPSGHSDSLCLNRMPSHPYHLYIRDINQPPSADTRSVGKPGKHCVTVSSSEVGKLVFIVAE